MTIYGNGEDSAWHGDACLAQHGNNAIYGRTAAAATAAAAAGYGYGSMG